MINLAELLDPLLLELPLHQLVRDDPRDSAHRQGPQRGHARHGGDAAQHPQAARGDGATYRSRTARSKPAEVLKACKPS